MFLKINDPKLENLDQMFIHRNCWFNLCDYTYSSREDDWVAPLDNCAPFDPGSVPINSVIYVTPWGIEKFLETIHPKINNPYILITYCYGTTFKYSHVINDPKILHWFGQANSNAITFDKFTIMPLGVLATNEVFNDRLQMIENFNKLRTYPKGLLREQLAYMNFMPHVNDGQDRNVVYNLFKDKPWCTTITLTHTWRKPFMEYMNDIAQSKFVISPLGDICDTYRHIESMLVGSIPIILTSPLNKLLEDLPAIIVNDYQEVTEDFLNKKYEEMKDKKYNLDKLYMKYWSDKVNAVKIK